MNLQIQNNIDSLYQDTLNYFPKNYINNFNSKESLVARYLISKEIEREFWIKNYFPQIDKTWKPIFDNWLFWTISHKDDLVFVWVSDKKIWIDIEVYKERDISVLNQFDDEEYIVLWWKNFENFFILWTAKESVIKYIFGSLDDMKNIILKSVKDSKKTITWLDFTLFLSLNYKWQNRQVFFGRKDDVFYSVCVDFE